MTGAWVLLKKDFVSHYRSWVGILSSASFLLISGALFTMFLFSYSQLSLEAARQTYEKIEGVSLTLFVVGTFLLNLSILLLFLTPFFSMRSFAEERRMGTLELLYTYPLSDFEIVLGKYLALVAKFGILFLPMLAYVLILPLLKGRVDWGIVFSGILGFFLLGSAFLAVGLFFSSLTENQISAAGLTFVFLAGAWVSEWFTPLLPFPWSGWLAALSPFAHFRDFSAGVVDLKDIIYFLSAASFFFFLTLRTVETRNWKG